MFYVFRPQSSSGARELATALEGQRLRNHEGNRFLRRFRSGRVRPVEINAGADHLIMWGAHVTGLTNMMRVLNNAPMRSKFADIEVLTRAGVPTVTASRTRPAGRPVVTTDPALERFARAQALAEEFTNLSIPAGENVPRTTVLTRGISDLRTALTVLSDAIAQPAPVARMEANGEYVGRSNDHVGGNDLLTPVARPDFYVRREEITEEYRIHSFLGRSIRAGVKQHRTDFRGTPSWIRSWDGGWRIVYDGVSATQEVRDLAHRAVGALGLDFGAVDIGRKADGSLIVLEVNRAPGLEGGTIDRYVAAVRSWAGGEWSMRSVDEAARNRANRAARGRTGRRTTRRAA